MCMYMMLWPSSSWEWHINLIMSILCHMDDNDFTVHRLKCEWTVQKWTGFIIGSLHTALNHGRRKSMQSCTLTVHVLLLTFANVMAVSIITVTHSQVTHMLSNHSLIVGVWKRHTWQDETINCSSPEQYVYKPLDTDLDDIIYYVHPRDNPDEQQHIALSQKLLVQTVKWFHQVMRHAGEIHLCETLKQHYHHPQLKSTIVMGDMHSTLGRSGNQFDWSMGC